MNYYSLMYTRENPRLLGRGDKYLHFHLLLDCHISFWDLIFRKGRALDHLAEVMEWCYELGDETNIRPLTMDERMDIMDDTGDSV